MAKTTASYTIMDYTDGLTLITGIDCNLPLTQIYDTTTQTFSPSWDGATSMQLTPTVIKVGSTSVSILADITSKSWARRYSGATDWTTVVSGSNGETISSDGVLAITTNKLTGNYWQIDYRFTGSYYDQTLKLTFPIEIKVTLSRVANGTSFVVARAYTVGGNQFKNSTPSSLSILSEIIRGTTHDQTDITYQWAKSTNGVDWTDLTVAEVASAKSATLVVVPDLIDSFAMFRCKLTDTDSTSDTYNDSFYTEGVSILDMTDPYQAIVESSAGSFFKNSIGSTVLKCRLFQNGTEIDTAGTLYTYTWTQNDKDGNASTNTAWASATKTGKSLTVSHDMIDTKGTFFCEVN